MTNPEIRLRAFQAENNIFTKGPLSLVVQFTRLVRDQTFPLDPDDFQTSGKGCRARRWKLKKDFEGAWYYPTAFRRRRAHEPRQHGLDD